MLILGFGSSLFSQQETKVVNISKSEFITKVYDYEKNKDKWVYEGSLPCIIDFYADWCRPCKVIAPVLEELAGKYDGKIIIYKVNTDKERELAMAFGIQSIPTLMFIPAEGDPQIARGALPKETLEKAIEQVLLK